MNTRRWIGWLSLIAVVVAVVIWRWSVSPPLADAPASSTKPLRIASLTLGTDEILAELVPVERIVCVTYLADDPEISNVPGFYPKGIARLRDSDPERIIGLNPDLVCVAPYNSADFLKVLERSGLSSYRNEACQSMDEIETGILDLGNELVSQTVPRIWQTECELDESNLPIDSMTFHIGIVCFIGLPGSRQET